MKKRERYKVFIIDIDQLINFNIYKTIDRFAFITSEWSNFSYYWNFTKFRFQGHLTGEVVKSFKEGAIPIDDFVSFLREKMGLTSRVKSQEVKESWIASCQISRENLDKIADFVKNAEFKYSILITISKDLLQYEHIVKQLNEKFARENLPSLEANENVILAKSFILGSAESDVLAFNTIAIYGLDMHGASLVSLSDKITSESVPIKNTQIIYREEYSLEHWSVAFKRYLKDEIFVTRPVGMGDSRCNLINSYEINPPDLASRTNSGDSRGHQDLTGLWEQR